MIDTYYDTITMVLMLIGVVHSVQNIILVVHTYTWYKLRVNGFSYNYMDEVRYRRKVAMATFSQVRENWFDCTSSEKLGIFSRSVRWPLSKMIVYCFGYFLFDLHVFWVLNLVGSLCVYGLIWDVLHLCTDTNKRWISAIK